MAARGAEEAMIGARWRIHGSRTEARPALARDPRVWRSLHLGAAGAARSCRTAGLREGEGKGLWGQGKSLPLAGGGWEGEVERGGGEGRGTSGASA